MGVKQDAAQLGFRHEFPVGKDAGALQHVSELAHVAFPLRFPEHPLGRRCQPDERFTEALCKALDERGGQIGDVLPAVAQRG